MSVARQILVGSSYAALCSKVDPPTHHQLLQLFTEKHDKKADFSLRKGDRLMCTHINRSTFRARSQCPRA